jgi:isopentenyl-diphosphate delta-isomerase
MSDLDIVDQQGNSPNATSAPSAVSAKDRPSAALDQVASGDGVRESGQQFDSRKVDHLRLSLREDVQAGLGVMDSVRLQHEALPDLNFSEIDLSVSGLMPMATPFLLSSMTAGHAGSLDLNVMFARASARRGWLMGVGSQRKELFDSAASEEWQRVRRSAPNVKLLGNIGISQLIRVEVDAVERLVDALEAKGLMIHLNALQEALQPEGTPEFAGGLRAIEKLAARISVPVIVKETGCGISALTAEKLWNAGVRAIDVAGLGGTHWGRIEGHRSADSSWQKTAAETFKNWGLPTLQSLMEVLRTIESKPGLEVWASGGLRSGLDAAKALVLGAERVGLAQPVLAAAMRGEEELDAQMHQMEMELRVAMFCTGAQKIAKLKKVGWVLAHTCAAEETSR